MGPVKQEAISKEIKYMLENNIVEKSKSPCSSLCILGGGPGAVAKAVVKIQYSRGSVLDLRPPGREFRIMCLEGSVISFISPSSGGSPGLV